MPVLRVCRDTSEEERATATVVTDYPVPEESDDDLGGGFFGLFDETDGMMGRRRRSQRPPRPGLIAPGRAGHVRSRYRWKRNIILPKGPLLACNLSVMQGMEIMELRSRSSLTVT